MQEARARKRPRASVADPLGDRDGLGHNRKAGSQLVPLHQRQCLVVVGGDQFGRFPPACLTRGMNFSAIAPACTVIALEHQGFEEADDDARREERIGVGWVLLDNGQRLAKITLGSWDRVDVEVLFAAIAR